MSTIHHVASRPAGAPPRGAVRFLIEAEAGPGLLPRLLQPFARRDVTPDAMLSRRAGDAMRVEITLDAAPEDIVRLILGNLGQVVGVVGVACLAADDLSAVA